MNQIDPIVAAVRDATDYQTNKRILHEKVQNELHLPYRGGMFKSSPELITFLSVWPDPTLHLEDTFQNPIEVDRVELLQRLTHRYRAIMNTWHDQYTELKQTRRI